jgi:hypothetical protein
VIYGVLMMMWFKVIEAVLEEIIHWPCLVHEYWGWFKGF